MSTETIQIRRYPNRRLYDRSRRQYVTLGDIEELVRTGHTIEVRDSRTDEDLTRPILAQILLERHPDKMEMFPVAMLHGILRANDLAIEFMRTYMRHSLAALEHVQVPAPALPLPTPLDWMVSFFPGMTPRPPVAPDTASMARRLAELEDRIERLEAADPDADPNASAAGARPLDRIERRVRDLEAHAHDRGREGGGDSPAA